MAENETATLTSEDIWKWIGGPSVRGRAKDYAARTGLPELLPDECSHQDRDLLEIDGKIHCYRCGAKPPGIFLIEE